MIDMIIKLLQLKLNFTMKIKVLLLFVITLSLFSACTPVVVEKVKNDKAIELDTIKQVEGPRPTSCVMFSDIEDGEDVKGNFAIYKSFLNHRYTLISFQIQKF